MTEFGVHSEVGRLRKVMVHRPDLSLQRLTPSNHDELLFDDVLWVERAQYEHDQFVARMRERGVEVFLLSDLLAETLAADQDARERLIELVASEYTVGWSLVDEIQALLADLAPEQLAAHLIGGLTVAEAGLDLAAAARVSLIGAALQDTSAFVIPPLPNTLFTRDSSCWIFGGVSINPMYWPARRREAYNVGAIYRAHPMFAAADFEFWYPHATSFPPESTAGRFETADFGRSSLEGGDVMPIGNGTVLIGMSERSQGRMIEQIAKVLFAAGEAERVIAAVMSKDRAHMHLDTVFTLLDRDKATAYPRVINDIRAISLRPGTTSRDFHITVEDSFLGAVADALGGAQASRSRDGRRRLPARAGAMGRRQQRRRPRARGRCRLRAEHVHDRQDARGGRRGDRDRGFRARQGPGRRALHDLSAPSRPCVIGAVIGGTDRT